MSTAKSGQSVPHQYPATPSVTAKSPEGVARVKAHPWRAFNPGWLSDKGCGDRVAPLHTRPIR